MRLPTALLLLVATAAASTVAEEFEGDGTTYTLGDTSAGNCNFMAAPAAARDNYAALNNDQWLSTRNCGRCAEVRCSDASCADQSTSVVVYILDRCPECKHGDLDLSPSVFAKVTGQGPSRKKIKWKFVDCPVSGAIKYCLKGGSNPFWTAIQPANTVAGVSSMLINGRTPSMVDSAYYYLLNGQSVTQTDLGSVKVTLTSVGGEVVEETVALSAGACTDGTKQFKTGNSGGANSGGGSQVTTPPATKPPTTTAPPATKNPTATTSPTPSPKSLSEVQNDADKTPTPTNATGNGFTMDGLDSETAQPGTVSAPTDESNSAVARLTPSPALEEDRSAGSSTSSQSASSNSGGKVNEANTKSTAEDSGTSPVLVVLAVAAVVGVIALAVVAAISQKKKLDDKRADRHESARQRSFDNFHSPVRVNSEIAQL